MARLLGPDPSSRLAMRAIATRTVDFYFGRVLTVYLDASGTTLAGIATYDPDAPTVPGATIDGSAVRVGHDGMIPLFWFPDGVSTLYAVARDGAVFTLTAAGASPSGVQAAAIAAAASDATSKVAAEAAARAAADALLTPLTRTISTAAPLTGGGDLSANRTFAVSNATTGAVGVVQLAGDLAGTATAPVIAAGAVTSAKILDGTIVDGDISATAAISDAKTVAPVGAKTTNYTITSTDSYIEADATSGVISINLPNAATVTGRRFTVKRTSTGPNDVTVVATFGQIIDAGLNIYVLTGYNGRVTVLSIGTGWRVVSGQRSGTTGVLDARDFGAKGDGIADDTAALQATLDASTGAGVASSTVRAAVSPVHLPRGTYKITAPLRYTSVQGARVFGDGMNTVISVSGNLSAAIILQGVAYGEFKDFDIAGSTSADTVTSAITLDWDGGTLAARSSTDNVFRGIHVRDLKYVNAFAFALASSIYQCDQVTVEKCTAAGQWTDGENTWWQYGFISGSGQHSNPLNHNYVSAIAVSNRYNVWANALNVSWWGGSLASAEADFKQTGARPITLGGFRSELSQRLFIQAGGAGYLSTVSIRDVLFDAVSLNADGRVIRMGYPGELSLENVIIQENGAAPTIYYSGSSTYPLNVAARNTRSQSAVASFFGSSGAGAPMNVSVEGYQQVDFTGAPVVTTARWSKAYNSTALPTMVDGLAAGGLRVTEGSNAKQGVVTLVGGAKVVANTSVTASSRIQLTVQSLGTVAAPKAIAVTARTAGTSFTITSADGTDTSVVAYQIFEPA